MAFFGLLPDKQVSAAPGSDTVATPVAPPAPAPTPAPPPIDAFAKLWQPDNTPAKPDPNKAGSIFASADLNKMHEAAKGVNFVQHVDPAKVQLLAKGGPEAAQAFMEIINDVGQRAYAQAAYVATQVTDQGLSRYNEGLDSRLPGVIKKHAVAESVASSNPAFKHPALAPVIAAVEQQFQAKYPHATAAEIHEHTLNYLSEAGKMIAGTPEDKSTKPGQTSGSASDDWSGFFSGAGQIGQIG